MKNIFVLFCAFITLIGCTRTSKVDILAEANAIRKLEADWTILNQKRDIAKVMEMYAPDAIIMAPGQNVTTGLETIRKQFEFMFADTSMLWDTFSWTSEKVEVSASGELAYIKGSNTAKMETPNGIIEEADKGVDIWRKIDGKWKAVLTIWNSNKPIEEVAASIATVDVFTRLENEWNNAIFKKDAKALDLLYAKEYTYTDPTGKVYDKQQDISEATSPNYKSLAPSVINDINVNLYGNVAVVKGLYTVKATLNGKDISGTNRFVDVFVMRDGRWQCVSTQSSRLPKNRT
jgi:ketosteroid isomerase-like protein